MNRTAAVLALAFAATASADEPALRGVVRFEGKPVAGAKLWLTDVRGDTLATGTSGVDGRFAIPLVSGKAAIRLFARDEAHVGWNNALSYDDELALEPALRLEMHPAKDVRGRLIDAAGKPLTGIRLKTTAIGWPHASKGVQGSVTIPNELAADYSAVSAADGTLAIRGVPSGSSAYLELDAPAYGSPHIRVAAGEVRDFQLKAAGKLRVRFDGAADPKLLGGTLAARDQKHTSDVYEIVANPSFPIRPDADQVFENLMPGSYLLAVELSPAAGLLPTTPTYAVIRSGETSDVTVKLKPAARLRGRVVDAATGAGVSGVYVYATNGRQQGRTAAYGQTDAEGRFGLVCEPGPLSVRPQGRLDGGYVLEADPIPHVDVAAGAEHTFPDIKLRPAATAEVTVVDTAGKPLSGVVARTAHMSHSFRQPLRWTDANGRVTLAGLDPDDWTVLRARTATAVTEKPVQLDRGEKSAKLVLSETAACRLAARVVDAAGKPVHDAEVRVEWRYRGVGKQSSYGYGANLGTYRTDADGRVTTQAMWPDDEYRLHVKADGFGDAETALVRGVAGKTHDSGAIKLTRVGQIVSGRVVDAKDKPVTGVRVFNNGDAPEPIGAMTDGDGRFTLKGFFDGPCFVFARHREYRFAAVRAASGDKDVTVRLVAADAPPAPNQPEGRPAEHAAAERALALHLAEQMWALPSGRLQGFGRRVLEDVLRLDPDLARRWYDDRKRANDADAGERGRLTRVVRLADAERVAAEDLDEALALLNGFDADESFRAVLGLAKKLRTADPAKAMRCVEEAAVRARGLRNDSVLWLARVAELAIDLGRVPEGRKLLNEAAEKALTLGDGPRKSLNVGVVASVLAGVDLDACRRMLARTDGPSEFNRWLSESAVKLAADDPDRAVKLLDEAKVERGNSAVQALAKVAVRAAAGDPRKAVAIAEKVSEPAYRVAALAAVAARVGKQEPELAATLIDRCFDRLLDNPDDFRSWSNYGGRLSMAAAVAIQARAAGYPDLASVSARVLACRGGRESFGEEEKRTGLAYASILLSQTDPATAKLLIDQAVPAGQPMPARLAGRREGLFAAALVDPAGRGRAAIDALLAQAREKSDGVQSTSLVELGMTLSAAPGRDRLAQIRSWVGITWVLDGESEE